MVTKSSSQVVKVEREKLKACMTCPLCDGLFEYATTISECLHTFCKKCIYEKITEEDLENCPVCNIHLGCAPLEKLRADNSLQDLRLKLFPPKRENGKAAPETTALPSSSRRKEKSSSSPAISSPITSESGATRRRSKPKPEKNNGTVPSESGMLIEEPDKKKANDHSEILTSTRASLMSGAPRRRSKSILEKNHVLSESAMLVEEEPGKKVENHPQILSSPLTLTNRTQKNGQNPAATSAEECLLKKISEENNERFLGMSDLWKSLNCLAEAAGQTKSNKRDKPQNLTISEPHNNAHDNEAPMDNAKECQDMPNKSNRADEIVKSVPSNAHEDGKCISSAKENGANGPKESGDVNGSSSTSLKPARRRKFQCIRQKRTSVSEGLSAVPNAIVEAKDQVEGSSRPVWFSLVASEDQETDAPLPQIRSCYLRVKDSSLPVSYIKKYIVKKLALTSEAEVEICLRGQPLLSSLQLSSLSEWWVQTAPPKERVRSSVGSSGKDFVMVLSYGRKAIPRLNSSG